MAQVPLGSGRLDLDLRSIRIIQAIEQTGSITAASRMLGLSQPAITQHLQRAEAKLGLPLVSKMGRNVRLSDAGQILAAVADQVIDAIDGAAISIGGLASLRSGRVSIAGFPSASSTIIPTLISQLKQSAPGLSVSYVEAEPPDAIELVADGSCDIALVARYPNDESGPEAYAERGLWARPLYLDQMLLILPESHPLATERIVDLIDLEDDEWVAGCPRCRGHVVDACRSVGFEPDITFQTDNFIAVLGLVSRGLGIAILPRLALGTAVIPHGAVVRRIEPNANREIYAIANEATVRSPTVLAVASALSALDGSPWKLLKSSHRGSSSAS
ncbi:MAG: LysR family transcriptional regulator [Rhodoglobus sp.]